MRVAVVALLTTMVPAVGGAAPGSQVPDPLVRGPFAVRTIEYDAGPTVVQGPAPLAYPYPERLRGTLYVPEGATGRLPVVLFLHGRHEACRAAGMDVSAGPVLVQCPDAGPAIEDLPSWRGYAYLAENLASHGYLAISINANAVNVVGFLDGTRERAALIAGSLDLLAQWNQASRVVPDGVGGTLVGRVDLARIGILGHSRGADAVGYFLHEEQTRDGGPRFPGFRAVFQLEGVDIPGANPTPAGVHFGALVGSCDADTGTRNVRMWERARYAPAAGPFARVLFSVTGANHNFFNQEWYDEWDPPPTQPLPLNPYSGNLACSAAQATNVRLRRADQERIGLALIASFMRRYVGGEIDFDPLMTGEAPLPPTACPAEGLGLGTPVPCDRVVRSSYMAPAADRLVLLEPASDSLETLQAEGFSELAICSDAGCPERGNGSIARQLTLEWDGHAFLSIPLEEVDASRFEALTFRAAMNPSSPLNMGVAEQDLTVVLIDRNGARSSVKVASQSTALERPLQDDGTPYEAPVAERNGYRSIVLNGVRLPLSMFHGLDPRGLTRVVMEFEGRGSIQVADVLLQVT